MRHRIQWKIQILFLLCSVLYIIYGAKNSKLLFSRQPGWRKLFGIKLNDVFPKYIYTKLYIQQGNKHLLRNFNAIVKLRLVRLGIHVITAAFMHVTT